MKTFLFIDCDQEIRDLMRDCMEYRKEEIQAEDINIQILVSPAEAEKVFESKAVDGIIVDALRPNYSKLFPFIGRIRSQKPDLLIIAMIGLLDMVIDEHLKQNLRNERVKFIDKSKVFQPEYILKLIKGCYDENNGEIL